MTTVAAAKKGKKICIACDSLTSYGNRKEKRDLQKKTNGKLIKFQSTFIGFSGLAVWTNVLTDYFKHLKAKDGFNNIDGIYSEMSRLHTTLKQKYFLTPQQSQEDIFESSELMLLLINSHGIFEVDWMRNVREYAQLAAIGTGDEYALGAMRALYQQENDPKLIVSKGMEAAAKFDQKTELPAFYQVVNLE